MKKLLFIMAAMLFANQGWMQNVQIIAGNGNSTQNSCNIPGYYGWHNSAMLFTSMELQSLRGNIQNLAFQIATPNDVSTNRSMKIWLKQVPKTTTALSASSHMNDFLADATLVYDSNNVAVTATGWRTFVFSTPFAISGDSNLLVIVSGHACGTNGGCEVSQYYTTATNKAWLRRINGASNIDFDTETGQPEYANNRFNTRFTITPDPAQCFSVLNLNVSGQTPYTAALQWTTQAGNTASEWEVQYKLNTVNSWSDPDVITEPANTLPYTLQNLLDEQTYNVRVRTLCNPGGTVEGTDFSAWSPEFTFTQPPSCPPPAALTVPTVTANSATAIWVDETLAQEYVVQWKKASASWDNESVLSDAVLTGEESFTLTQLQPGTIYNVRMRTVCDYGVDSSSWVSATFTTQCGVTSVDVQNWTEGFEELAAANTLPPCWSATNFGSSGKIRTQITDYNSTQFFRYAHTGHSALYFTSSCDDNVKTPSFALTADSTYRFSFWYHTDGLDGWLNLSASVFDENDAFIDTIGTPLSNITNTDYRKYQGTFTPAASGTYYFSIKCQSNHSVWYLTIDDILLGIAPACPDVEYFTAIMHSPTSAALNWDLTASTGNGWLIAYSNETPFDPETADHIPVAATDNFPYIINGLEDGTTYNFAVQADCGGAWTDPVAITFPSLNSIKTVPYQQNFENTNDVAEWFFSNGVDNNGWYIGSATSNPAGGNALYVSNNNGLFNNYTPHSGSGYGYVAASAIVNFGNYQSYTLSFDWYCPGAGTYVEYACLKVFAVPMNYNLTNAWPSGENVHQIGGTFWHQLDWQHFYAVLPADIYANQQYKIVFMFSYDDGNAANPAPAIDNLAISGSDCSVITSITASAITTNSASITFSDSDPAQTAWEYVYGVAGIILDPNSETPNTTNNNSFTLNGLNENTTYNIWVRSTCASTAEWSQACTFLTRSSMALIPYSCTFESSDPETTTWTAVNSGNNWEIGSRFGNGPSQAGTEAAYIDGITSGYGAQDCYYYRVINFGATPANFDFSFDYISRGYLGGTASTALYVWLVDENTPVTTTGLPQGNALSVFRTDDINWHLYSAQLLNISGTKKLVFGYSKTAMSMQSNREPVIDNISIEEIVCPVPTEVTAVTDASNDQNVSLSWSANGGTGWIVYYKPVNEAVWSSVPAATNPTTLQGLTLSTAYNIYVVTDCGSGTVSNPSETIIYYAPCVSTGFPLPYTQNFDAYPGTVYNTAGVVPSCWASTGTYALTPHITGSGNYHYPHSGSNALAFTASGGTHSYAVLPAFSTPIANSVLSFWYQQESSLNGTLQVGYITGSQTDISTFTPLADVPVSVIFNQFTYDFPTAPVDLSNATYIVLHWSQTSGSYYSAGIDDIEVNISTTCPTPKNLNISPVTHNSATVSWTGSATQWEVAWKTTMDDIWSFANVTGTAYNITDLTATTNYDVKVRTVCAEGDSSIWSSVSHFITNAAPVCTTPVISNATPVTPTTATASWIIGTATKWIVEYKTAAATEWTYTGDTVTTNSILLTDLTPGTGYQVRVKAICDIDFESEWSAAATFTTSQLPCVAPTNLHATSISDHTIDIAWSANGETNWTVSWAISGNLGNAPVSGSATYALTDLLSDTTYRICVKAICISGSDTTESTDTCIDVTTTSINDISLASGVKLYPNPASDQLTIEMESRFNTVEVINTLGQVVYRADLIDKKKVIDVTGYSAGMYYVKLQGDAGMVTRKFVKR